MKKYKGYIFDVKITHKFEEEFQRLNKNIDKLNFHKEANIKTIWVYRKNEKAPQLIKADKFNSELHKKLFWKNLFIKVKKLFPIKINWNNPWLVTIIGGLVLYIIISKF